MCFSMFLCMCGMITCVRPKLNLGVGGGGNSKIYYVTQGGAKPKFPFRYIGGRGSKMTEIGVT